MPAKARILLVDDEPHVTTAMSMVLRRDYDVVTAGSGDQALALLETEGPFAVLVSDMRMPGMNGARLLATAAVRAPDTTRILLTGQADVESAIAAVNEGHVFRFLSKPTAPTPLRQALAAAVEECRLRSVEHELLENTLRQSVQVLVELLGLVQPEAALYAGRTHALVQGLCDVLQLDEPWRFTLAATLSHLGCVTVGEGVLDRAYAGGRLTPEEEHAFRSHPGLGSALIEDIPRLEDVAWIVARQHCEPGPEECAGTPRDWEPTVLGGELLRLALALVRVRPAELSASLDDLLARGAFAAPLLEAARALELEEEVDRPLSIACADLRIAMTLAEDLLSKDGVMLARTGTRVGVTLLTLVRNFVQRDNVQDPISVYPSALDSK